MKLDRKDPLSIHQLGPIAQQVYWVRTESGEDFWGPYTTRHLADRVQKIACMAGHEDAEVSIMDCDEEQERLTAGLLPWRIEVELEDGKVQQTTCSLMWPPEDQEGIIRGQGEDGEADLIIYFVWAKTEIEAKRRLASLNNPLEEHPHVAIQAER